jgi:hypothetical protein
LLLPLASANGKMNEGPFGFSLIDLKRLSGSKMSAYMVSNYVAKALFIKLYNRWLKPTAIKWFAKSFNLVSKKNRIIPSCFYPARLV